MSNETKSEIIKSLAYGMSAEVIADCEDVAVEEVEKICRECTDEITQMKLWLERRV